MSSTDCRLTRSAILLTALMLLIAGGPGVSDATADTAKGTVQVSLGSGGKGLRIDGVRLRPLEPARVKRGRLVLPVSKISVPLRTVAALRLRGGLSLTAGKRRAKLTGFRVKLTTKRAFVEAKVGGSRVTLFSAKVAGKATLDPTARSVGVTGAKLVLTKHGSRALRMRLKVRALKAGPLGKLRIDTRGGRSNGGTGGGGGGPAVPGTDIPDCVPGNGAAIPAPVGDEPPQLARPATAVAVKCAAIVWRPRESFIQYVNGDEGTSVGGGAVSAPEEVRPGSDEPLVYRFRFPLKSGWYDAGSGKAALYFQGRVRFHYSGHTIDLGAGDPEVEIAGPDSRAIFRFDENGGAPERGVLVDLTPGTPVASNGGKTLVYAEMPGTIPEGTDESVFSGFYAPGDPFGSIGVSFTTP